jgi:predicted alpha/beta-hydrolase family hydrolase
MSFNVPDEVKIAMLEERIKALNVEGYQHELNKKSAEAIGNADVVAQSEESIAIIASAIAVHEQELSDLA